MDSGSGKHEGYFCESLSEERKRIAALSCADEGCGKGHLDPENFIILQVRCEKFTPAYPCDMCGRLHWGEGDPISGRNGKSAFLENGEVVQRGEESVDR